ncbi:MFS transporter [Rhizobium tubonense]|uniref:MFS transporter n=1 Tax=Rhizobium tubonense TaxID=484088 RepID=A0A2W4D0L2_9HYPH|nr:MFS transporter [Rhizobium tubonense]PZM17051.1 MFS transporter [Rhizobium tubonense]
MSDIAVDILDSQTVSETPSRSAIALVTLALAVGSFGIGTGEFVIMGLLPDVARTFDVSTPQAGHVISAYALGVVVGAPVIAVLAAKMARRTLLLLMMTIFTLGNISSAMAPTFESFTALRFITGLPHGAFFGVAALVAASMVPINRRVRAVGQVMLGLTIATLVGTPIATFLGQMLSWRAAFMMVGAVGALTVVLIAVFLPKDKVSEGAGVMRELGALRRVQVWLTLAIAAVGFGGMFSIFTYIASATTDVAGMSPTMIPIVLALFGIGMNVGNVVGSRLADISLTGTIGSMLAFNVVIMTVFSLTATNPMMLCICVFLVGCGFAACPAVQTRLMDVAADAQTLAAASNHSAFNVANALGAWLGGLAISWGFTAASTGYVGAVLSAGGLVVFVISISLERRGRTV